MARTGTGRAAHETGQLSHEGARFEQRDRLIRAQPSKLNRCRQKELGPVTQQKRQLRVERGNYHGIGGDNGR